MKIMMLMNMKIDDEEIVVHNREQVKKIEEEMY